MNKEDNAVWNGFFSTCVGWSMHPGYYRENATRPTLEDCAATADKMLVISKQRLDRAD